MTIEIFYVVWRLKSLSTSSISVKHTTQEEALKEAERLAKKHVEDEFVVLKSISSSRAVNVSTEFHDEIPF